MIPATTSAERNQKELQAAYAESRAYVARYLEAIKDRIHDMPPVESSALAWDHVGSMNKVKSNLAEIFTFLTGHNMEA